MLIKYIRTPKKVVPHVTMNEDGSYSLSAKISGNDPIGMVVATGRNQVGWSLCCPRDKFNKERAKEIAINRADFYGTDKQCLMENVPFSILDEIRKMYDRSERYYK